MDMVRNQSECIAFQVRKQMNDKKQDSMKNALILRVYPPYDNFSMTCFILRMMSAFVGVKIQNQT